MMLYKRIWIAAVGLVVFLLVRESAAQAPDYTWVFDDNGNIDYVLTSVSSTDVYSGSIPANDPTLNLQVDKRYRVTIENPLLHPFAVLAKGANAFNDVVLLGQGGSAGSFEGDAGVNWVDDSGAGAVEFTVTQNLVDAMNQGTLTPGYRCNVHITTMRGDFNVEMGPPPQSTRTDFVAFIEGSQAGTTSTAVGTARFVLDTDANTLDYEIRWGGFDTPETVAHIHGPADPGESASPIHTLPAGNVKTGTWNYDEADEADILAGRTYVNIHSEAFPPGEIRGQIVNLVARMDGVQPATGSPGTGIANFIINTDTNELAYFITFAGLEGTETVSHIHGYSVHTADSVPVHPLALGSPKVGVWNYPEGDEQRILTGQTYVNIHSDVDPGGEIRGQVTRYVTTVDGGQAGNAVDGIGFGLFSLDDEANQLGYHVEFAGLSSPETQAHFHGPADPGEGAGVLFGLSTGSPKLGIWDYDEANEDTIKFSRTYVNIHTQNLSLGEIRGQTWIEEIQAASAHRWQLYR